MGYDYDVDISVRCDECGNRISSDEDLYCKDCYDKARRDGLKKKAATMVEAMAVKGSRRVVLLSGDVRFISDGHLLIRDPMDGSGDKFEPYNRMTAEELVFNDDNDGLAILNNTRWRREAEDGAFEVFMRMANTSDLLAIDAEYYDLIPRHWKMYGNKKARKIILMENGRFAGLLMSRRGDDLRLPDWIPAD